MANRSFFCKHARQKTGIKQPVCCEVFLCFREKEEVSPGRQPKPLYFTSFLAN